MSAPTADFVVVGAGIAGASAAYELAARGRVVVLEQEEQPGYHSTGRSAAIFHETYGRPMMRRFATGSRRFLHDPPDGFAEHPLLTRRGVLFVARDDQLDELDRAFELAGGAGVERIDGRRVEDLAPAMRRGYAAAALHEPGAYDVDVHALHQGFLRGTKRRGGALWTAAELISASQRGQSWHIETSAGPLQAPVIVDAAGAWGDVVAERCGVAPIGLTPLRRTALIVEPWLEGEGRDGPVDVADWPMVIDVDEDFYFKPDAGRVLISPADETARPPSDVQPDANDVAVAIDRIQRATRLRVERVIRKWAGLRTFARDRHPVVGFEPGVEGFFWLVGQGGNGIMMSAATARLSAALACGDPAPTDLLDLGIEPAELAPGRFGDRFRT